MSDLKPLHQLAAARQAPEALLAALCVRDDAEASARAGVKLVNQARQYGIEMRDFLRLAVDPTLAEKPEQYEGLNGYEAALKYMNLPIGEDFDAGITLDLASDTFQYSPGTRALFPEVVDDLGWAVYPRVDAGTPAAPPVGGDTPPVSDKQIRAHETTIVI